jgi:hypothetical protein
MFRRGTIHTQQIPSKESYVSREHIFFKTLGKFVKSLSKPKYYKMRVLGKMCSLFENLPDMPIFQKRAKIRALSGCT